MNMKYPLLILAFLSIGLVSCGDDDTVTDRVVGRWLLVTFSGTCDDGEMGSFDADNNGCIQDPEEGALCFEINFREDNTVTIISFGETDNGNYTIDEESETISFCQDIEADCLTAILEENTLKINLTEGNCMQTFEFRKV